MIIPNVAFIEFDLSPVTTTDKYKNVISIINKNFLICHLLFLK